ncbi:LVIVD repeat-containing protein [Pyxidicoccus sp. 3LG]
MTRGAVACLMSSLLGVVGCGSDEKEPEVEQPWDGSVTPQEEQSDWVDTGPYAACKALATRLGSCGATQDSFDLSGCRRETLGNLDRQGIYRAKLRLDALTDDGTTYVTQGHGSFRFDENGKPSSVYGYPFVEDQSQVTEDTFFIKGLNVVQLPGASPRDVTYMFVGCEAPSSQVLTGCFSVCSRNTQNIMGTFHAERMTWGPLERRSAGGLRPLSESPVELGSPADVYVAKDHAYVVSLNKAGKDGGLTIFDVTDRNHPIFKGSISIPGDNYWNGVWAKGDALYVASSVSGLLVFDISNPAEPTLLRSLPGGPALNVHTVLVDGDRLYAMAPSPNRETLIFDVATPTEPRLLGRYVIPGLYSYPHDAFSFGGRLYINHGYDGYQVADVSDPANGQLLGAYGTDRRYGTFSHHSAVGVFGGHTLAFEGGEGLGAHLRVLKVDDPANIVKVGEFKLRDFTSIHNLQLVGERLYIAWYQEGVRVLDVSNPTKPRMVAWYNTFHDTNPNSGEGLFEGALGIRVPGDGYVYVADDVRGLLVFKEL